MANSSSNNAADMAGSRVGVTIDVGSFHPFTVKVQKGRRIAILDAIVDALGLEPGDTIVGAIFAKVEPRGGKGSKKEE